MSWNLYSAKKIPLGIDHVNAGRTCAVDVAYDIHLHPVGIPRFVAASLIEEPSVAQGPIGFHIKHANVATGRVVDIEERLVRREAQAIGVFKVIGNRGLCLSIGRQTKNAVEIEIELQMS